MNEHEQQQPNGTPTPDQRGFEDESAPQPAAAGAARAGKGKSASELKANFNSVFGHGLGKASLVLVAIFLVIAVAFAIRGLNKPDISQKNAQVDVPNAPKTKISIDPIDAKEAERRSQRAAIEAEAAQQKGQTYQPGFNPVISSATQPLSAQAAVQPLAPNGAPLPPPGTQPVQVVMPAPPPVPASVQLTPEEQRRIVEADKQRAVRDKYVDQLRNGVEAQADELLNGKGKDGGMSGRGIYSTVRYELPRNPALPGGQPGGVQGASGASGTFGAEASAAGAPVGAKGKTVFKAGKTIFATLDAQVNTDDGGDVFATVRGGPYDGAKLIGKIEQAPRNIRLRFAVLAPQDDRPTMQVNAVAIREDDARQGVADNIDYHTLERYTALFAGSMLSGIGKAAAQPQGETIVLPNGQLVVSQPELTNKRIAMFALGEVGTNAGNEIRRSFNQPPTYSTPANRGIGIIFLADVLAK